MLVSRSKAMQHSPIFPSIVSQGSSLLYLPHIFNRGEIIPEYPLKADSFSILLSELIFIYSLLDRG